MKKIYFFLPQRAQRAQRKRKDRDRDADIWRDIAIGKILRPQDISNVIAFLASGLAPHPTGTTIDINGASYVPSDNYYKIPLKTHTHTF